MEDEILRNGGGWFGRGGGGGGGGVVAREMVDGGAYSVQLAKEVIRRDRDRRRRFGGLDSGREVVKGEYVSGHHS